MDEPKRRRATGLVAAVPAVLLPLAIVILFRPDGAVPAACVGVLLGLRAVYVGVRLLMARATVDSRLRIAGACVAIVLGIVAVPGSLLLALVALLGSGGSPGRPLRVAGVRRLPGVVRRAAAGSRRRVAPVPRALRPLLAALWREDARAEHASVAAFERLARDLADVGAPAELASWARRAATEERNHAEACFAIAGAYAEADLSASDDALPAWAPAPGPRADRVLRLARESLEDGCVEELAAARGASIASRAATDAAIADTLARIAADEAGHARLADAIVAWALADDPSLGPALRLALGDDAARRPAEVGSSDGALLAHGRIGPSTARRLVAEARAEVWARLEAARSPVPLAEAS